MVALTIESEIKDVTKSLKRWQKVALPKSTRQAMNKTITAVRSVAVKAIAKDLRIKQKAVRAATRKKPAKGNTIWLLVASVIAYGGWIPLIQYKARQTRRGVTHAASRGKGRKLIPGAFIARMPSGHRGVYLRQGGSNMGRGPRRRVKSGASMGKYYRPSLPIRELWGGHIPRSMLGPYVMESIDSMAYRRFQKEFHRALTWNIEKVRVKSTGLIK